LGCPLVKVPQLTMSFFWQLPEQDGIADLPDPAADDEEQRVKEAASKRPGMLSLNEEEKPVEPAVQWPPVKPLPPAESDRRSRGGRDRRRRGGTDKAPETYSQDLRGYGQAHAHLDDKLRKRDNGWPVAPDHGFRRRPDMMVGKGQRLSSGKWGGYKGDEKGGKNSYGYGMGKGSSYKGYDKFDKPSERRSRGGRGTRPWDDLPPRPPRVEETVEAKAKQKKEEAEQQTRAQLRMAASPEELKTAIEAAKELGLHLEASLGEKKLQRMEG